MKIRPCNHYNNLIILSYWENAVIHSKKLEFYNFFKNQYKTFHYLDHTGKNTERKALVKLRTGNHELMIKIGRYDQISLDNNEYSRYACQLILKTKFTFSFTTRNTPL